MEHEGASMLRDGVLLLGFALGFVLLFRRLGLGATLGYLVAGAVVGPQVLGLVGDAEEKIRLPNSASLLLFVVGLELNPAPVVAMSREFSGSACCRSRLRAGAAAVIYLARAFRSAAALALGLPLGLSSTAQVLPMLQSPGGSAPRSASGPSRSCCSRTSRSSR